MKKRELLARIEQLERQVAELRTQQSIDRARQPAYIPPLGYIPPPNYEAPPVTCDPVDWRLKGWTECGQSGVSVTSTFNPALQNYTMTDSRVAGQYLSVSMSSDLTPSQRKNLAFNRGMAKWCSN